MPSQKVPFHQDVVLQQDYRLSKQNKQGHLSFRTIPFYSYFFGNVMGDEDRLANNQLIKSIRINKDQKHACGGVPDASCVRAALPVIRTPPPVSWRKRGNWVVLMMPIIAVLIVSMLVFQYVQDASTRRLNKKSVSFIQKRLIVLSLLFFVSIFFMTLVFAEFTHLNRSQRWAAIRQNEQNVVGNPYFPNRQPDVFKLVVLMLLVLAISLLRPTNKLAIVMSILFLVLYMMDAFYWRSIGTSWFMAVLTTTTLIMIIITNQDNGAKRTALNATTAGLILGMMLFFVLWRLFGKK